jgi:PhzF family phenazine biosynthesis protein
VAITIHQVDAFTDRVFAGNPAGVCMLDHPVEAAWMQAVAREMNLSETAFLNPSLDGYQLRWFTPATEVDLCGHATLASAHVLWATGVLAADDVARFHTRSGPLAAVRRDGWIEMDFPSLPVTEADVPAGLAEALHVEPVRFGRSRDDVLVEVASEAAVRACTPDFSRLLTIPARGVIVTSRATMPGFDFVSRFFAPAAGVYEDPVTGSAHCALAPYWAAQLGRDSFDAYQVSARGGVLRLRLRGDRVILCGQAVSVLRCELL